ncbi:MAG: RNA polymerase sigma factor [Candidatus Kapabacteria bacterium]|nr:RNA polymerase sigma factor [Candidatus Kapabacteria bacterium]MDW8012858.1 RNA polymerase sigma factor [Bacteroidota bacterium]
MTKRQTQQREELQTAGGMMTVQQPQRIPQKGTRRRKGRSQLAPEQVPEERRAQYQALVAEIERLYRTDRKRFLGFIRQRVRTQEEAEDILQDVFANVLAAAATVEGPIENVASWVFTAVRNRIIDSYRKKRAESFSDVQSPIQQEEMESFENLLPDWSYGPEREEMRRRIWKAIQDALAELPPEQREVFVRNEFEGISFREMAEETGININTLLARKRYAVLHLRKKLKWLYEELNNAGALHGYDELLSQN